MLAKVALQAEIRITVRSLGRMGKPDRCRRRRFRWCAGPERWPPSRKGYPRWRRRRSHWYQRKLLTGSSSEFRPDTSKSIPSCWPAFAAGLHLRSRSSKRVSAKMNCLCAGLGSAIICPVDAGHHLGVIVGIGNRRVAHLEIRAAVAILSAIAVHINCRHGIEGAELKRSSWPYSATRSLPEPSSLKMKSTPGAYCPTALVADSRFITVPVVLPQPVVVTGRAGNQVGSRVQPARLVQRFLRILADGVGMKPVQDIPALPDSRNAAGTPCRGRKPETAWWGERAVYSLIDSGIRWECLELSCAIAWIAQRPVKSAQRVSATSVLISCFLLQSWRCMRQGQ